MTQKIKNTEGSIQGSFSISSKNSFNDSFRIQELDVSYEQDENFSRNMEVNSSLELHKDFSTKNVKYRDFNEL